jgi:integrase/recombinase XerD
MRRSAKAALCSECPARPGTSALAFCNCLMSMAIAAEVVVFDSMTRRPPGKGRKLRTCPLWPATIQVLRPLVAGRTLTDRVFLNRNHEPFTRSGIYGLVKRYAARASLKQVSIAAKRIGPHVIRHSTASHLLRAGVDINTIRGWLGHVSLDTTNIYAEIDLETKARALDACAITESKGSRTPWRQQRALMEFLHAL